MRSVVRRPCVILCIRLCVFGSAQAFITILKWYVRIQWILVLGNEVLDGSVHYMCICMCLSHKSIYYPNFTLHAFSLQYSVRWKIIPNLTLDNWSPAKYDCQFRIWHWHENIISFWNRSQTKRHFIPWAINHGFLPVPCVVESQRKHFT